MSRMRYSWKEGTRIAVSPNVVGRFLDGLRKDMDRPLKPKDVLDAARPPSSPLHAAFEWDEKRAAEKFRLQQAGHILRSITYAVIVREANVDVQKQYRFFTKVVRGYETTEYALSNEDTREQALHRAFREFGAMQTRYEMLKELSEIFDTVDATKTKLERRSRTRRTA